MYQQDKKNIINWLKIVCKLKKIIHVKLLIAPFVIGLILVCLLNQIIFENISISEPLGYYIAIPYISLKRNQLVLACISNARYRHILINLKILRQNHQCMQDLPYLIKKIVAVPNDIVIINKLGVFVNDKLIPNSKGITSWNKISLEPLPVGYFYKLKQNEYFLLGSTPHSFDSRYFGFVDKKDIYRIAYHL